MATRETYENGVLVSSETIPDRPRPIIPKTEFFKRFTAAEIRAAYASTVDAVTLAWMYLRTLDIVDLNDAETLQAVRALRQAGILTPARQNSINKIDAY